MVFRIFLHGSPLISHGFSSIFPFDPKEFLFTLQGVLSVSNQLLAEKKLLLFLNIISQSIIFDLLHQTFTSLLFILVFSVKLACCSVTILNWVSVSPIGWRNILAKFVKRSEGIDVWLSWSMTRFLCLWSSSRSTWCVSPEGLSLWLHICWCACCNLLFIESLILFEWISHRWSIRSKHIINLFLEFLFLSILDLLRPKFTVVLLRISVLLFLQQR